MRRKNTKRRLALIEQHRDEVFKSVRVFLRQHPEFLHLEEDLTSEGMARLVDTVDRFINGRVEKFIPYLRLSIRSGLWEAARTDDMIQSPRNCPARQVRDKDLSTYPKSQGEESPEEGNSELLDAACQDDPDRVLIGMLRAGNSLTAIASELMISLPELRKRGEEIAGRLRELIHGKTI